MNIANTVGPNVHANMTRDEQVQYRRTRQIQERREAVRNLDDGVVLHLAECGNDLAMEELERRTAG